MKGEKDSIATLFSFDLQGTLFWKKEFGREMMTGNWTGSLSTPTVVDDLLYVSSGTGDIACLKRATGDKVWGLNMVSDLNGEQPTYGYSQSLLVDRDLEIAVAISSTSVFGINTD